MYRYEEDDIDALSYFILLGAVALVCVGLVVFMVWWGLL